MIDLQFLSKTSHHLISVIIVLIISLYITTKSAINMIEKKRIKIFIPFFILGIALCLSTGLIFYGFYGVASDIYLVIKFVLIVGLFFILWGKNK